MNDTPAPSPASKNRMPRCGITTVNTTDKATSAPMPTTAYRCENGRRPM